jgi:hypothetical protein
MILLTDEEIEAIRCVVVEDLDDRDLQLAKAQLKKVVEWLKMRSFEEYFGTAPKNCYKRYRVMTIAVWQALLEEVK